MRDTFPFQRIRLLACLLVAAALPGHARAQQVQRCIGADGQAVYTDRRCDDIGAVARLPPAAAAEGPRLFRGGCPRVLSQLVGEIGAAIQGRDVNRLAAVYDWSGASNASASRLLDRLEAMVDRPLVDIAPVYPAGDPFPNTGTSDAGMLSPAVPASMPEPVPSPPPSAPSPEPAGTGPATWMSGWNIRAPTGAAPPEPAIAALPEPPPPPPPARPHPVALRVEQVLGGSATPVRTVFGLRRRHGCFWIAL
jgi:hypothetical protein